MSPEVPIRHATTADALRLSVLATQVFLDTYATKGISTDLAIEATSVYSVEAFSKRLGDRDVEILVAERGEYLLGFVDMALATACPTQEIAGLEVFRLYVQASFHGSGLGRAFMAAAEQRAHELGASSVWLTAWVGNRRAIGFYEHLGYEDAGAAEYVIEGKAYENRVLAKRLSGAAQPLAQAPTRYGSRAWPGDHLGLKLCQSSADEQPAGSSIPSRDADRRS